MFREPGLQSNPSRAPRISSYGWNTKGHDSPRLSKKEAIMKPLAWKILLPVVAC